MTSEHSLLSPLPSDLEPTGHLRVSFRTQHDGLIASAPQVKLFLREGALQLQRFPGIALDMEDTADLRDNFEHTVTVGWNHTGTTIWLDGYHAFCTVTNLFTLSLAPTTTPSPDAAPQAGETIHWRAGELATQVTQYPTFPTDAQVAANQSAPTPDIVFATSELCALDIEQVRTLTTGTIWVRFRVRGPRQYGTIIAAGGEVETLNLSIDETGITFRAQPDPNSDLTHTVFAAGNWDDGHWHDLAVRVSGGATDIYVDGWLQEHAAGQFFFGHIPLNRVTVGMDTHGVRLMGEVRKGGIYRTALTHGYLQLLSHVPTATTVALFDNGYQSAVSYRIPALVTTPKGTVIAACDQRVFNPNDAPNHINFVIRRSFDEGNTWGPLQTVLGYPADNEDGPAFIDSCLVCDQTSGRIIVLIDYFPGGIGLPNNERGMGVDKTGRFVLVHHEERYLLNPDGTVVTESGQATDFRVERDGTVRRAGEYAGNIHARAGTDPHQTLLVERTSFIVQIYSDDEGDTWSAPQPLNHAVKEPWMHFMGVSPGNGIQLQNGPHRGRLLIPYYFTGDSLKHYSSGALISDDGGKTWTRGASLNDNRIFAGQKIDPKTLTIDAASTHETVLVERQDGTVVALFRNQHPSARVGIAVSEDGGQTWQVEGFHPQLPEIFSQPNAIRWPGLDCDRIVFANASRMLPFRGSGVVRLSEDGGRTWPIQRCVNPGHYVYQCLCVLPDNSLGLLWERETNGLYFTKLPMQWFGIDSGVES